MPTLDRTRACRSCRCPGLRTYRPTDTYCAACGHRAAEHIAQPADERIPEVTLLPVAPDVPVVTEIPVVPDVPEQLSPSVAATLDEPLEEGWGAVIPSGRFFAVAIASAGVGLIVAGLAMRFETLLVATPWPR